MDFRDYDGYKKVLKYAGNVTVPPETSKIGRVIEWNFHYVFYK